ncbi:hypothetical protein KEM55_001675 [Ascosphaera atra]|nr:hypothetical protein KEM55_001675 [Ascosphaera atra]
MRDGRPLVSSSRQLFSINKAAAEARAARSSRCLLRYEQKTQTQTQVKVQESANVMALARGRQLAMKTGASASAASRGLTGALNNTTTTKTTTKTNTTTITKTENTINHGTAENAGRKSDTAVLSADLLRYRVRNREVSERKQVGDAESLVAGLNGWGGGVSV